MRIAQPQGALAKEHVGSDALSKAFKATELGMLPADWDVEPIKLFSKPVRGGSPRPAGDPRYFDGAFIPWLTVAALTNLPASTIMVTETETCLTEEGSHYSRTLEPGTVIIANSGATLGVAKILGIRCCANDGIAALLNLDEKVHSLFVVYYFNSKIRYLREVVARGNGQPNLNTTLIGDFFVPIPPLGEQEVIAKALRDLDAYIDSLERLIVKKRAIKQGAMQDLLTGERRLPGFEGEWRLDRFGRLVRIRNEKINTLGNPLAEYCVELEQIEQASGGLSGFSDARERSTTKYTFFAGDVLFGRLRPYLRKFWQADRSGVCSTEIWPLVPTGENLDAGFLRQVVQSGGFIEAASAAYGTHMPRADWKSLAEYSLTLPPSVAEQSAIAKILSDMDDEIAAVEQKLAKARQIKQGMMQELLTGRVRLV